MIKMFDLNTMTLEEILDRTEEETVDVTDIVTGIIDTVRQKGDQALLEYAKKFDKADLNNLVVTQEEIDEALASIDTYLGVITGRLNTTGKRTISFLIETLNIIALPTMKCYRNRH